SHDGDLPARSGMGSSSAFTVGLVNALAALQGKTLSKSELTSCALHIEQDLIRENVGSQDQTFAAHGGFNKIFFQKDGSVKVEPVASDPETFRALEKRLMLFFTGISREASAIAVEQIQNIPKRKNELETMAGFVDEACKFLQKGPSGLGEFGALLHEAWQVKKSLSSRITTDVIDEAYALARKQGATGGKILGAGGGGFLLVFAEPERQAAIRQALGHWVHVPFSFENAGSEIIFSRL
ncbi:MAG: kinase, partial [Spirochaetia bacterium]|nr:kinase [Spirochaetia bacterium]